MANTIPDNQLSTYAEIERKIRLVTRSMSENVLSSADIQKEVNRVLLYDMSEELKLFNLLTTFTFYTQPLVDTYENNTTDVNDPFYNFLNKYNTVNPPCYAGGYQLMWSQSLDQFYGLWPKFTTIMQVGAGDGVNLVFVGNINAGNSNNPPVQNTGAQATVLKGEVLFDSIDVTGNAVTLIDYPQTPLIGTLGDVGNTTVNGTINYSTGDFQLVFNTAPAAGQPVNCQFVLLQPARPQSILFYDGKFTLRPVPDQAYKIEMEAYKRPLELLLSSEQPELSEWWEYIAYLASKKILENRNDYESIAQIMPALDNQRKLINRRTVQQLTKSQRAPSIYSDQLGLGTSGNGFFGGPNNF
jgi:hypothetical protein